jgi:tetratricopeptide (TPR) repeat protein
VAELQGSQTLTANGPALWLIDEVLGEGGMGEVCRVAHARTGRQAAMKRVRSGLTGDPSLVRRFEAECRIAASLNHPNIVRVIEVIQDPPALIMELLEGGSLGERLRRGMHLSLALVVVSDVARALAHAWHHGVVHGDIKPGNVLFRDADTVVLVDFGLASDGHMHLQPVSRASLQYASPEILMGQAIDHRSDLYSLGVVLYEILTGDLPWRGENTADLSARLQSDAAPRVPIHLAIFQPVIDRLLRRQPEARFQDGEELAAALERIRVDGDLPPVTIRTAEVTSAEIRAVADSVLVTFRDPRRAEARDRRRRRQRIAALTLAGVVGSLALSSGAYWLATHPERLQDLLAQAGFAEQPGLEDAWNEALSLRQDPNQGLRTLVAAYERVLAIDAQHEEAREGLAGLADQWKRDIDTALRSANFSSAETRLMEASNAFPGDADFVRLLSELDDRRNAEALLATTRGLLESHGLSDTPSATAAIQALNEVLRLAPDHPAARRELLRIAGHYALLAEERVAAGDVETAIGHLDRASTANPDLAAIAAVRQSIQQANTTRETITQFLEQARLHRESGALVAPAEGNAAALYHQVLSIDPDNTIARQGLDELVAELRSQVATRLRAGRFNEVADTISRASAVNLDAAAVDELRRQLVAEQTRVASINRLLTEARAHVADGFLTLPESGNATFKLREVQRLDPGNAVAAKLLREVAERLAIVAREAWQAGMRRDALEYLDLALAIVPGVTEWQTLRDQWAAEGAAAR